MIYSCQRVHRVYKSAGGEKAWWVEVAPDFPPLGHADMGERGEDAEQRANRGGMGAPRVWGAGCAKPLLCTVFRPLVGVVLFHAAAAPLFSLTYPSCRKRVGVGG